MSKRIYFVRHGESEGNTGIFIQTAETPLTEKGVEQAKIIANRISNLEFDLLVASTYHRAIQTAEFISKVTKKPFITSDLLVERLRPSEQFNTLQNSLESQKSQEQYLAAFVLGEKYKDGESYYEITNRAKAALEFLEKLPEEKIVVVSHGMFLRVICAVLLLKKHLNPQNCLEVMSTLKTKNTGITVIEKDENNDWRLVSWNDHAHFAEY